MAGRACAVLLAVAALVAIPAALAEEVTREQYRDAAEPICKVNAEANTHILKGVRSKVRAGQLKAAGGQFTRAAVALKKTLKRIEALPMPVKDEKRLAEWQDRVGEEAALLQNVGKALLAEKTHRAEVLSVKLTSNARLTNAIVIPFEFTYCRLEPNKYA
jgi:hypothetical protein